MEIRCYCKILHISCKAKVMNEEFRSKIQLAIAPYGDMIVVKICKLK